MEEPYNGERGVAAGGWIVIGKEDSEGGDAFGCVGSAGTERAVETARPLAAEPKPPGDEGMELDGFCPARRGIVWGRGQR